MALALAISGIVSTNTLEAKAAPARNCMHISCRASWTDPSNPLRTCFKDYCPKCGIVFGTGTKPCAMVTIPGPGPCANGANISMGK